MRDEDMPRLLELSPANEGGPAAGSPSEKNPIDFDVFPTIVAVADYDIARRMLANGEVPIEHLSSDGLVVGYAQFSIGPDKVLHSQAIRVSRKFKNQGIGELLCQERIRLGRAAGAIYHLYGVHPEGEIALQKILLKLGMHLCCKFPSIWLYAQDLNEVEELGYDEPEWHEDNEREAIGGI
jgi:ribosomal protein S18 acetylase RimI-like enzyme